MDQLHDYYGPLPLEFEKARNNQRYRTDPSTNEIQLEIVVQCYQNLLIYSLNPKSVFSNLLFWGCTFI